MTRKPRILIADCHEDVLMVLERTFEDGGFDTTTAWTAADAIRWLDLVAFDLVLLNEYLAEGTAEHFLRALRRRGIGTPCIVMQPSAPPMLDSTSFRSLGVLDIVGKHDLAKLLDSVRAHVPTAAGKHELHRAAVA